MDKFKPNRKNTAIRTHCKNFATILLLKAAIMVSIFKVWPWNKLKGLDVFNVIKLKYEVIFFTREFMRDIMFLALLLLKKSWREIFGKFLFRFCAWQRSLNMANLSVIFSGGII